jgi:RNA polymerase sigma-70 factor (ECF subfamily)
MPWAQSAMTEPIHEVASSVQPERKSGSWVRPNFDALYDEHFAVVWRMLRALGVEPASLDDATQDVFVAGFRQLDRFEGRSSVKTWLCGIACNVASNYRRREHRKGGLLPLNPSWPATGAGPLEQLEQAQAWNLVSAFLETLDEGKRRVYALSRIEGLSAPEIAEALEIPVNTVYSRLGAAQAALQKFLAVRDRGVAP